MSDHNRHRTISVTRCGRVALAFAAVLVVMPTPALSASADIASDTRAPTVEQVERQLANASGLQRARLLARLANHYKRTDSERSVSYAVQAISLLDVEPDAATQALAQDVLAWAMFMKARYNDALAFSEDALELAQPLSAPELSGQIHYTRGAIYLSRGNIALGLQELKSALKHLELTENTELKARTYSAIGGAYRYFGDFEQAMSWQYKAYETALRADNTAILSAVINNLGDLYDNLGQPERSLDFYLKALALDGTQKGGLVVKSLNVGGQYLALGRYDEALRYYHQALAVNRKFDFAHHDAEILQAIGTTHLRMGDAQRALDWLNRSLKSAEASQVETQIVNVLIALSSAYVELEDYSAAIGMAWMARTTAEPLEEPAVYARALRHLATAYKAAGDHKNALDVLENYNETNRELLTERAKIRLAEMQSSLEAQEDEREILRLQQENRIRQLQLDKQRTQRYYWIGYIILLVCVIAYLVRRYFRVNEKSRTDDLTSVPNRRHTLEFLQQEFRRFKRYHHPCCVMILDIDNFKRFNDNYGHDCGDLVLTEVAATISRSIRDTDLVGRWGGEEFVVVFPHTDSGDAALVAERLRAAIEAQRFTFTPRHREALHDLQVSITGGLTALAESDEDVFEVIKRADMALYQGKQNGRNRIERANRIADEHPRELGLIPIAELPAGTRSA
ncbi:MAG: diguanylate cyclase [Halieaceae bacterium]|nr:diguanylate cyclase [Halieaceae bacterium]